MSNLLKRLPLFLLIFAAIFLGILAPFLTLFTQQIILYVVLEGAAILFAIFAAIRTNSFKIYLLAFGLLLFFIGDSIYVYFDLIVHSPRSFPNVGDIFYLAFYVFAIEGLRRFVKGRRDTILDAALLAIGVAVPWWIFVEYPVLAAADYSFMERFVSAAYPLGDLILFFFVVRILLFRVPKTILLLASGLIALMITDSVYSIQQLEGSFVHGSWLDYGWGLFYLFCILFFYLLTKEDIDIQGSRSSAISHKPLLLSGALALPAVSVIVGLFYATGNIREQVGILSLVVILGLVSFLRTRALIRADRVESDITFYDQALKELQEKVVISESTKIEVDREMEK